MLLDSPPRLKSVPAAERKRGAEFGNFRAETLFRKLEPRIMFDGAALATAVDAVHHDLVSAHHSIEGAQTHLSANDIATLAAQAHGPTVVQAVPNAKQVVFIDAAVQDPAAIERAAGPNDEIVLLDAHEDGLSQIAQFLSGHAGLDAIHIVSHGAEGEFFLGSSVYNASTIRGFGSELAAIGASLHSGGDILLYGCDVAEGTAGDAFVHKIASLTHANVAASTNLTGDAAQGGDWVLEDHAGSVHTVAIAAADWHGDLAALNLTPMSSQTAVQLAQSLFGPGVTVNSAAFSGLGNQAATFSNATAAMPNVTAFNSGVIFATGTVASVEGPSTTSSYTANNPSGVNNDPQFNAVSGGHNTYNDTFLTATITPASNKITVQFVFMSEEYPEFVYSGYNDAMAFFVNGVNAATVPNGLGVSIDTLNDAASIHPTYGSSSLDPNPGHSTTALTSADPSLFVDNSNLANPSYDTQADGFTKTISFVADVNPGVANTIKVGIANTGDNQWDSWLLIKANSAESQTIATPETVTTLDNTPVTINPLASVVTSTTGPLAITQIDDTPITAGQTVTMASGTQVTLNADNTLTLTPNGHDVGTDAFSYLIQDSTGTTALGTTTVITTAPPPVAGPDNFATAQGVPVLLHELANDSDPSGFALTVTAIDGHAIAAGGAGVAVTGGTVTLAASGDLTFSPTAGYSGTPSFTYTIDGGHGATADGHVSGTVYAPPAAANDTFAIAANTPVVIAPLANDSDPNGFALTVTAIDGHAIAAGGAPVAVAGGTVTLAASGSLTFSPTAGYAGTPSFTYSVDDGHGGQATAAVNGTVWAPPAAANDTFAIAANTPVVIAALANDSDPNGFALTVTAIDGHAIAAGGAGVAVAGGTVTLAASGGLTFTPSAGYAGTPSFTYSVDDGHGGQATAAVNGTVWAPPAAANDTFAIAANTPVVIAPLANDSDPNGFALTVTAIDGHAIAAGGAPVAVAGGTVTLAASGGLTFTPSAGYAGTPSFTYSVDDGHGGQATATVNGTVWAPPAAANDTFAIAANTPVVIAPLANDSDPNGFALTVTAIDGHAIAAGGAGVAVAGGTVTLAASGGLTFTPSAGYAGTPSFTYSVDDGHGGQATAAVNGTVWAPPAAANDTFAIAANTPVVIAPLANDSDPNGFALTVTAIDGHAIAAGGAGVAVAGGTVTLAASGGLTFTPSAGYAGTPSFTYSVDDGHGGQATAAVNGTVWAPPAAANDTFAIAANTPVVIAPLGNDSDPNGFALTVTAIDGHAIAAGGAPVAVAGGTVTLAASGSLTFSPTAGYAGTPSFTYSVDDGHGGQATAAVNGTVWAPPAAANDTFGPNAGVSLALSPLTNDTDPNGFALSITAINGHPIAAGGAAVAVDGGSVMLHHSGHLTFIGNSGYSGTSVFTYTVSDGHGGSGVATISGRAMDELNITQFETIKQDHIDGQVTQPAQRIDGSGPGTVNEYVHFVAGVDKAEIGLAKSGEHVRISVEGVSHKLDRQYGAGGEPVRLAVSGGRDTGPAGLSIYEPLAQAQFWHDLKPLNFDSMPGHFAKIAVPPTGDFDGIERANVFDWQEHPPVAFSQRLAQVREMFDRSAMRIGADLANVA